MFLKGCPSKILPFGGRKIYINGSILIGQILTLFNTEFNFASQLHYVRISFDTPKFEKITKDRAAKWTDMLSAIGGTLGLLTGFSIISGVEILYFAFKIALDFYDRYKNDNIKDKSILKM